MNRKQIAKYCIFLLLFMEVSFAARRSLTLLLWVSTEEQSALLRIRNVKGKEERWVCSSLRVTASW